MIELPKAGAQKANEIPFLMRPRHINYFGACGESVSLLCNKTRMPSAADRSQATQQSKQVVDSS